MANKEPIKENTEGRPNFGYEYLDHTADVQLHTWGRDIKEAFEQSAKAMFGYMTDLDTVEECSSETIEASGHDLQSALFNFLDEWLFVFSAEPFFIPFKIEITEFSRTKLNDSDNDDEHEEEIVIKAVGFGETFSLDKHPQGTEVKAITYSAMQITERPDFCETFVIIDI